MRRLTTALVLASTGLAGCKPAPSTAPAPVPTGTTSIVATRDSVISAQLAEGEQLVTTVCIACHTIGPPPAKAPPFRMVAMRYRRQFGSGDSAVARIAAYVAAPSTQRSIMPAMVIDRFGLMPAIPLPDAQLRAAARYVLSLDGGMGRMGMRGAGAR